MSNYKRFSFFSNICTWVPIYLRFIIFCNNKNCRVLHWSSTTICRMARTRWSSTRIVLVVRVVLVPRVRPCRSPPPTITSSSSIWCRLCASRRTTWSTNRLPITNRPGSSRCQANAFARKLNILNKIKRHTFLSTAANANS